MNADDARRGEMAELARLLPAPAERELQEGRQHTLREHLMSEIRLAGSLAAGTPAMRRRRRPAIAITGAVAAGVAATIALTVLPGTTSGAPTAAAQLLAKIATAAARQPAPAVRDNQFSYIESWVANQVCEGGSGSNCTTQKPQKNQIWQSVSNECVTGLLRQDGHDTPLVFSSNYLHCPYRGGVNDPTYRFMQSLPTDPHALLSLIEREMSGQLPRPEEAFTTIGDLLGGSIAPPQVSAALYRAAALIPGVTVVADATDAVGRHGVAVAFTYQGMRTEWIFSKLTLQWLGARYVNVANGETVSDAAILQRAFVDRVGQLPR
jgi:hypothetical protein